MSAGTQVMESEMSKEFGEVTEAPCSRDSVSFWKCKLLIMDWFSMQLATVELHFWAFQMFRLLAMLLENTEKGKF